MKNTGKEFEALSHKVFTLLSSKEEYTSVEQDVLLDSPDGPRQFDVVIRSKVSGLDLLTIVECRDYNKNLDVSHVDGLQSKMQDVNANKAVLVAKKGFSKTAKQKAERYGITLCTAHDLDRDLKNIGLQVPITFISIDEVQINASYNITLSTETCINQKMQIYINDIPLLQYFKNEYLSERISSKVLNETLSWKPTISATDDVFTYDADGNKIKIQNLKEIIYIITWNILFWIYT